MVARNIEKRGWGPNIPFKGTPPITKLPPTRPHLLKGLPSPYSSILGTTHLTHGLLGDTYSNHSIGFSNLLKGTWLGPLKKVAGHFWKHRWSLGILEWWESLGFWGDWKLCRNEKVPQWREDSSEALICIGARALWCPVCLRMSRLPEEIGEKKGG
jgi:hypothetical protein